jgi:pentalenene oxygenase
MKDAPRILVHQSLRRALDLFNKDRFDWLDQASALGPLVEMRLGRVRVWVVTNGDIARQVLLTDEANWLRPSYFRIPTRQALGDNLFTLSEPNWRSIGPTLSSHFRTAAFEARLSNAEAMIADDVGAWPTNTRIDLDQATSRLALRTASWLLFGDELSTDRADELVHHQRTLMEWLGERISSPGAVLPLTLSTSSREVKEHRAALDAYVGGLVKKRRRSAPVDDVLGALLTARPQGSPLTDSELCGHVAGFIGAGNEVTAATLGWALVYGSRRPDAFAALGSSPETVRTYALETIRLSSCAWSVTRRPRHGVELTAGEVRAKVGRRSAVLVYLRGMNRNPESWDHPEIFDPDRQTTVSKSQQRSFIPFGLGQRGCVGQHLAMIELITALPILAKKGSVVIEGPVVEDARFATRVRGGLWGQFVLAR